MTMRTMKQDEETIARNSKLNVEEQQVDHHHSSLRSNHHHHSHPHLKNNQYQHHHHHPNQNQNHSLNNKLINHNNKNLSSSPSSHHPLNKRCIKSSSSPPTGCSTQNVIPFDPETLDRIEQVELQRHWGPHLVPLQFVIQRTIAQVFNELQVLSQVSPGLDDYDRKKRVIDFVIQSRRQLIKLLVLVKWSSNSISVHKIMSIVGFLQRQNSQFERTVNILRSSKENFHSARMRNYDLPTALQVLTTGYPTLPGRLIEEFESKPKLTDSEVIKIMKDLNDLIRYRLASHEVLPKEFRSYRISDGRVVFTVERMFECSLTLGGGELNSQWYLLHLEFLFKVTGPRGKDFMAIPQGPVKNQIVELGNRIMAPSALPTESNSNPPPPERPIMKLFAYLRDLCLNYQLEALYYQASQLGRSAWGTHTRLSIPPDRSTMTIMYWTHARPVTIPVTRAGQQPPKLPPQPIPQGSITIRRKVECHSPSRTRVLDFLSGYPSKDEDLEDCQDEDFGASYTERLQVIWRPIEVTSRAGLLSLEDLTSLKIHQGHELKVLQNSSEGSVEFELRMDELCLEDILQRAARVHTDCILRRSFSQLAKIERPTNSPPSASRVPYFSSVRLIPWETESSSERLAKSIEVIMHGQHAVEVLIDQFSGRFRLQSLADHAWDHLHDDGAAHKLTIDGPGGNDSQKLRLSAHKININPAGLREVLVGLKSEVLLDQIEFKARTLGIRTTRNLPIRQSQITIGMNLTKTRTIKESQHVVRLAMYCRLTNFPHHYLLIMLTETGMQCALIIVNQSAHQRLHRAHGSLAVIHSASSGGIGSFWAVCSVSTIPVPSFFNDVDDDGGELDQFTLSRTQLQYVYHHCLIQVTLAKLMAGLKKSGISYEQLLPLTTDIIQKHQVRIGSSSTSFKLPNLHPSFEVVGLLSIPLLGLVKPCFIAHDHSSHLVDPQNTDNQSNQPKNFFAGHHLAVQVFLDSGAYFGVRIEIRFKFDPQKIQAEELERIIKCKQNELNCNLIAMRRRHRVSKCLDELTGSTLFNSGGRLESRENEVKGSEEDMMIVNEPGRHEEADDDLDEDYGLVDTEDWSIDRSSHQFIMRFDDRFNYSFDQMYDLSIQRFLNLIRASPSTATALDPFNSDVDDDADDERGSK